MRLTHTMVHFRHGRHPGRLSKRTNKTMRVNAKKGLGSNRGPVSDVVILVLQVATDLLVPLKSVVQTMWNSLRFPCFKFDWINILFLGNWKLALFSIILVEVLLNFESNSFFCLGLNYRRTNAKGRKGGLWKSKNRAWRFH